MSRPLLSAPPHEESAEAARLRGDIFTDLDRLAFALEMEAAALVEAGDEIGAAARHAERLGVRLAQRLVSGVWAVEVNGRFDPWRQAYEARLAPTSSRSG